MVKLLDSFSLQLGQSFSVSLMQWLHFANVCVCVCVCVCLCVCVCVCVGMLVGRG